MSNPDTAEQLGNIIVELADESNVEIDLVSTTFINDEGKSETIEYVRRNEHTNIVSIAFDDDTVYDLAVSVPVYDSLKAALETCEDFQDVIVETIIDEDPSDE